MIKVEQMLSPKTHAPVANQFILNVDGVAYFQSYRSMIVKILPDGTTILDPIYWNYSRTTSKYRNEFLRETTKETEKKIKSGLYTLANLN